MKKRIAAILAALAIIVAVLPPARSGAAQTVCFTAANDALLPLRDATMPAYFGTKLYVPSGVFAELGISSGLSSSQNNLYVYRDGEKLRLNFFISLGMVMDQTGETYETRLEIIGDVYFLPLDFMCEFFGLSYELLMGEPLSVLRITNSEVVLNKKTFLGHYKRLMEQAYAEYNTPATTSPSVTLPPIPAGSAEPEETPQTPLSYSDIDIYLSFFNIDKAYTEQILNTLSNYSVTACFFITGDEIFANAELVRKINGEGHTIGLMLSGAEQAEYEQSSALLFEAAKLITPLVTSIEPEDDAMISFCEENALIYCSRTMNVSSADTAATVTARLPITGGNAELRFDCSSNTQKLLSGVLHHLYDYKYNVRTINETYSFVITEG